MKIVQIVSGMYIASAGPSYSIARLCDEMLQRGNEVSIVTSGRSPAEWPYHTPLQASRRWMDNRLSVSPGFVGEVRALSRQADILHGHSLWRFANNVFPLALARDAHCRIVCSPRGAMSSWSLRYKRIVKLPFWLMLQKPALERCHCFHVTGEPEYRDVRQAGLRAPVAIIPNGVDIPADSADRQRKKQIVFLGRINPVKGIDMLIRAWSEICGEFQGWELVIAGPLDDAYAAEMQKLADSVPCASSIRFVGELLGAAKTDLLHDASLFVLPSHSENFGMVVAEALAHGLPVITTTATPWKRLVDNGCGWLVAPDEGELRAAVRNALLLNAEELDAMGSNGRRWMEREYGWGHVASMMLETYRWLQGEADRPDWVILE